ncbi:MAG: rhodanese-like domain-containing protein [Cellvibrionaceae bacterium]
MHAINREEMNKMIKDRDGDFVLINVLPPESFNQQHIQSSINIPLKTQGFARRVAEVVGSRDRKIVVYCANFDCDASTKAATELEAAGFGDVYDYEGGTKDWFEHKAVA